jgi:hypothetical protein
MVEVTSIIEKSNLEKLMEQGEELKLLHEEIAHLKEENLNLKTDNNNNDCKKNISPDLCNPIKKEKSKNKWLEKSKSQFNNIIKTKINELNNILYDKIKDKNFSFRKFTI